MSEVSAFDNYLSIFQEVYHARWSPPGAAEFPIIGHTDTNFPEEIALAVGCHTMLITGDPSRPIRITSGHADSAASQPYQYLLEAIVSGRYAFVDLICATGGDRWLSLLDGALKEERRLDPEARISEGYFLERLRSTSFQHRDYNLARMRDFAAFLEKRYGRSISQSALREAISTLNRTRRLLQEVSRLRKLSHPVFSGCDALQIGMASMLLPKQVFNRTLAALLSAPSRGSFQGDRVRLHVSGSNVDNLLLYRMIENFPAIIISEDTAFGDRYAEVLVSEEIDPMEALADRYTYKPLDAWMLGMRERIRWRADAASRAGCDGVIYFHLRNDDPIGWDWPDQKTEFEKRGLPVLLLYNQPYAFDANPVKDQIESFVEELSARKRAQS